MDKQLDGSASFYDGMTTYSAVPGKAVCRLVWNMDGEKNLEYCHNLFRVIDFKTAVTVLNAPLFFCTELFVFRIPDVYSERENVF